MGRLVQLQRVTVPGLLVTAGLACGPGGSGRESGPAPLQEAGALLGASGLQVSVRGRLALGSLHLSGRCCSPQHSQYPVTDLMHGLLATNLACARPRLHRLSLTISYPSACRYS